MDNETKFDLLNSFWIIFTLIPFMNGLPFLMMGRYARRKDWMKISLIYSLPTFFLLLIVKMPYTYLKYFAAGLMVLSCIISFLHVLWIRKDYLNILKSDIRNNNHSVYIFRNIKKLWWNFLSLLFMFNGFAFIFIGANSNNKKWIIDGIIYELPLLAFIFVELFKFTSLINIIVALMIISVYVSFAHALYVSEDYLNRLELMDEKPKQNKNILKKQSNIHDSTIISNSNQNELIDINNASSSEIANLPGINIVLAKKIIQLRNEGIYFNSIEDLGNKLNLKPHQIENIKPLIIINPKLNNNENGRKIDF